MFPASDVEALRERLRAAGLDDSIPSQSASSSAASSMGSYVASKGTHEQCAYRGQGCPTCKASGKVGKDLTRKVNADPDTDPEGMQRTNGSSYVCGPCYNFILSWRKEEEYRSQATRKTRAQTSRARHPMPVASRASRATEVDALAADGERPPDSALIVVISQLSPF